MELVIISPESSQTHEIAWFEAHTATGSFVILPKHAPMILILAPGRELIFGLKSGKQDSVIIPRGIVEITRTRATVLINKPLG